MSDEEKQLLSECRELLWKYSDEVEYQLNERHHEGEGLAEWQQDKVELDALLAKLDEFFKKGT